VIKCFLIQNGTLVMSQSLTMFVTSRIARENGMNSAFSKTIFKLLRLTNGYEEMTESPNKALKSDAFSIRSAHGKCAGYG